MILFPAAATPASPLCGRRGDAVRSYGYSLNIIGVQASRPVRIGRPVLNARLAGLDAQRDGFAVEIREVCNGTATGPL